MAKSICNLSFGSILVPIKTCGTKGIVNGYLGALLGTLAGAQKSPFYYTVHFI
jgi:hypothetical protein